MRLAVPTLAAQAAAWGAPAVSGVSGRVRQSVRSRSHSATAGSAHTILLETGEPIFAEGEWTLSS